MSFQCAIAVGLGLVQMGRASVGWCWGHGVDLQAKKKRVLGGSSWTTGTEPMVGLIGGNWQWEGDRDGFWREPTGKPQLVGTAKLKLSPALVVEKGVPKGNRQVTGPVVV